MRKQFITALATVLTSSMIAIPVEAARPDINAPNTPWDPNATAVPVGWTEEDANVNAGPIEEDAAIMDAFGGVEKYRASYEIVTPEYFKSVYAEVAKSLQPQVDTTSTETIINSAAVAVNNHFTKDFSVAINAGLNYGYTTRALTDYVAEGRMHGSYEPAVLLSFLLTANGVSNDIYANYLYHNDGVTVKTDSGSYIAIGLYRTRRLETLVTNTMPAGMYNEPFYKMDMGAYEAYLK